MHQKMNFIKFRVNQQQNQALLLGVKGLKHSDTFKEVSLF